ncbi:hypothetical protein QC334_28220 [Streptomyces sp. DH18]|uniref:hypothetical protein n=1 Tax=Streptomyces sp. DH18 TaxID=3040126 RepID=UPI00244370C1|nr:hypothetical protein [Streptomyces sp. DH18]MDG9686562.1 hypothetical protein [Streptomyces sp. DH18]
MGDLRDEDGYLSNKISGGNFYGPVNQFRDVHGISTFFLSLLAIPFIGGLLKAFK